MGDGPRPSGTSSDLGPATEGNQAGCGADPIALGSNLKVKLKIRKIIKIMISNNFRFFLFFHSWLSNLAFFDLRFGFLIKNSIYSQLGMSRIPKFDQKMTKIQSN